MSEFMRYFRIKATGAVRYPIPHKMEMMEYNEAVTKPVDVQELRKQVEIVASWRHVGFVYQRDIPLLRDNIVDQFRNVIYGEFENKLIEMQRHLYEYEVEEAQKVMNDILKIVRSTY